MASCFYVRKKNIISHILLLMFILDMVFIVWGAAGERRTNHQPKLYEQYGMIEKNNNQIGWTNDRERVRYWRWKNRNRLRNRRNRIGLNNNMNQLEGEGKGKGGQKRVKLNKTNLNEIPLDPYTYVTESMESCCPTVSEVIEPVAGRNRTGHLVQLYQDDPVRQRFYEFSCEQGIINKPCKFLENRHSKQSKCTQQHIYTYALVRPHQHHHHHHDSKKIHSSNKHNNKIEQQPWSLDYITIRSGCACQVIQTNNKKRRLSSS